MVDFMNPSDDVLVALGIGRDESAAELAERDARIVTLEAENATLRARVAELEATAERAALAREASVVSWCPQCGPYVHIDDDGLCQTCGATAFGAGAQRACDLEAEVATLRAQLAAPPVVDRDALRDAIADALGSSAYDCSRVWEAWGYETMSQDDFRPVVDDEDRLMEIVDAVVDALKVAPDPAPLRLPSVEDVSARVHDAWMESKRRAGVTSRKLEDGEELMVPYADLSEQAKELDRATVRAVYTAIGVAGAPEPAPLRLGRGPTVEEAKAHADAQEDGHGWWLVSFDVKRRPDDEAIYFEIASIEVEDGEVFVDEMSSADGSRYTEITDAIPLSSSRQPCGVGVKA